MSGKAQGVRWRRGFRAHESGSTLPIFGLAFLPVMLMLGVATDYTNITRKRSTLQQATDVATLTVAARMDLSVKDAEAKRRAQVILSAQTNMAGAEVMEAKVQDDGQTLCVTTRLSVPTAFMRVAHFETMTAQARSCACLLYTS
ncbi:MAG: pilus assembly protein TadG-related protein, partial [Methylocystis sp.]|nr:pilus assembly protein TadG-related protein [Methylocystis sp.]